MAKKYFTYIANVILDINLNKANYIYNYGKTYRS
jgi:hypothetical protein